MARNTLNDFSETASDNTDIGGVPIAGSSPARNIDDAARATVAILAKAVSGTTPVNDTWAYRNATDTTKQFRHDGVNIPTGTSRVIDAEGEYQMVERGGAPSLVTHYETAGSFTHTFATTTKRFRLFMMGAGGDGGNVDGQGGGMGASASGGNSGNWGWTAFLAKGSIETGSIVIGAPGTAATGASDNGCDGNDTTWSDGTNSFAAKGGKGGTGRVAGGQYGISSPVANGANTGSIHGTYRPGDAGQTGGSGSNFTVSVAGGSTPYGTCVPAGIVFGGGVNGNNAIGNGAGGGGAAVSAGSANFVGGRGGPGMIIVEEY